MTCNTRNAWRRLSRIFLFSSILLLTACGLTGPFSGVPDFVSASSLPVYTGPVAAPQVAYRIDEGRYFEIVPNNKYACMYADLFYVDKGRGIRSYIYPWREGYNMDADFIIDAANDQYLVAPVDAGSGNCSSGGGTCPGPGLIYSLDAGKSWNRGEAWDSSDEINLVGSLVYSIGDTRLAKVVDLEIGKPMRVDWKYVPGYRLNLRKQPIDRRLHCDRNEKG
jgi:hypothetical protein